MFDGTIAKLDGKAGFGITNACTTVYAEAILAEESNGSRA
jgi:hypothetical protein